ncbi:MAG TPA: N-acetylmuramoyl-L-alanine amidase [Ideonella sp.]|uniref:N-acetylmuramoyl-L-alanine amidase family protein n=1 Tax=Ideonella sp. TaxID=1929293 RepID=UPI002E378BDB|nr:N-acetylmuramoyl-L-alanine amidase [Ideonella sp.]HEX5684188.1 N-acetylmuramoyl-L-alanine amidase [Ideonella sp.]
MVRLKSGSRVGMLSLMAAASAAVLSLSTPVFAQEGAATPATQWSRSQIESTIGRDIQRRVDAQRRIEGQGKHVSVAASLNTKGDVLTLNLSVEFLPKWYGAEFEDLLHELATAAEEQLRDRSSVRAVKFRIGGRDIYDYFPEDRPPARPEGSSSRPRTQAGTVVLGAGHGVYRHYGFNDWRAQRDPSNGITEDFITPAFANELSTWLVARSSATTLLARSTATTIHAPSTQEWWKMGARYYLEDTYPNNPEIWHSKPNDTSNLRERNEDIRSRPLFANHVGATTVIHLHTNAADASATGARAFYHTGRTADQTLADNMLCYMGELIHAKEGYEEYTVPKSAGARDNLGENSLATMPSVIIEAGFHTNPTDAAALQDPVFRTAAMKGVEKGYRLTGEGKPCELFKVPKIADSTGLQGVPIPVKVPYKGYPEFAVTATVEIVSCPAGWTCTGGTVTYSEKTPSPLKYTFSCNVTSPQPAATFGLRTTLKDIDDVKTKPVDHNVTCTPSAQQVVPGKAGSKPTFSIGAS